MSRYTAVPRLERVWTVGPARAKVTAYLEVGFDSGSRDHVFLRENDEALTWPDIRIDTTGIQLLRSSDGALEVTVGLRTARALMPPL